MKALCGWFCVYGFFRQPKSNMGWLYDLPPAASGFCVSASSAQPRRRPAIGSLCFFSGFCVRLKKQRSATGLKDTGSEKAPLLFSLLWVGKVGTRTLTDQWSQADEDMNDRRPKNGEATCSVGCICLHGWQIRLVRKLLVWQGKWKVDLSVKADF